jgi:hypothetical protein
VSAATSVQRVTIALALGLFASSCLATAPEPTLGTASAHIGSERSMTSEPTLMGQAIERIHRNHEIELADGLIVEGDARLVQAVADGSIADWAVLERMPPVLVITFAEGDIVRYRSRAAGRR